MGDMVAVADWLGRRGPALKPEDISFVARPSKTCRGCLFNGQPSETCRKANALARLADIADCDFGVVYVLREVDPRQLNIKEE